MPVSPWLRWEATKAIFTTTGRRGRRDETMTCVLMVLPLSSWNSIKVFPSGRRSKAIPVAEEGGFRLAFRRLFIKKSPEKGLSQSAINFWWAHISAQTNSPLMMRGLRGIMNLNFTSE
jgi:hypothetical protein